MEKLDRRLVKTVHGDGEEKSLRRQEGTKSYDYRDSQIDNLGENQREVEILDQVLQTYMPEKTLRDPIRGKLADL